MKKLTRVTSVIITALAATFAGPLRASTSAPAPHASSETVGCEPGWTLNLEALSLRAFQGGSSFSDKNYDFGGRAALGYQFDNAWFTKVTYFGYHPGSHADTFDAFSDDLNGSARFEERSSLQAAYLDWTVGKKFKPTADLMLSPVLGLRWASFEENFREHVADGMGGIHQHHEQAKFEGLGPVAGLDATRTLGNGFSLYGTAQASVIFGNNDYSRNEVMISGGMGSDAVHVSHSDQKVVTLSELGLGVQYDFSIYNIMANLRAGLEGQLWTGLDNSHSEMSLSDNNTLAGFVLGANFHF